MPSTSQPLPGAGRPAARPVLLVVACALVGLEVVALVVAAVLGVVALVRGGTAGPVLFIVVLALGMAALLAGAARALWNGLRWGRGPVLTTQIFVVVTATTWWSGGGGWPAVLPLLLALVIAVAVLTPRVVAVTSGTRATGA